MPFGPAPEKGATFSIGCDEVFGKNWDEISFDIVWKVPQDNLADYYGAYTMSESDAAIVFSNDYFTADLVTSAGTFNNRSLFSARAQDKVTINASAQNIQRTPKKIQGTKESLLSKQHMKWAQREVEKIHLLGNGRIMGDLDQLTFGHAQQDAPKKGFVELKLKRSFLHREYREIYTRNIVTYAADPSKGDLELPKEPYTPLIKSISLSFKATSEDVDITANDETSFTSRDIEFFHMTAFGQMRQDSYLLKQEPFPVEEDIFLLPQYRNEGEFYIGIANIDPLQSVSLLFQLVEGSSELSRDKAAISWHVLADNYWRALTADEILADGTNSFLKSGIMRIVIPEIATKDNTILTSDLIWLKASIVRYTDAVCAFLDVKTNVGVAVFSDKSNDPAHLSNSLAPKSITGTVEQIEGVKTIAQPYSSFGGAMREDKEGFYTRVSERLRHKMRSVTMWDYERMVLDGFPFVYKAKCLSHTSDESLIAPGHVTMVVVGDVKNKNSAHALEPKVDKESLIEIEEFLKGHMGMFNQVHVENPVYDRISLHFFVSFYKEYEFGHYKSVLNDEIVKFLTPWAYGEGQDIVFGGHIHKSVILDFIEDRPYVDYVTGFHMYQDGQINLDEEVASATDPRSILVSARHHTIEPV
jgi:hypothetical protein